MSWGARHEDNRAFRCVRHSWRLRSYSGHISLLFPGEDCREVGSDEADCLLECQSGLFQPDSNGNHGELRRLDASAHAVGSGVAQQHARRHFVHGRVARRWQTEGDQRHGNGQGRRDHQKRGKAGAAHRSGSRCGIVPRIGFSQALRIDRRRKGQGGDPQICGHPGAAP